MLNSKTITIRPSELISIATHRATGKTGKLIA